MISVWNGFDRLSSIIDQFAESSHKINMESFFEIWRKIKWGSSSRQSHCCHIPHIHPIANKFCTNIMWVCVCVTGNWLRVKCDTHLRKKRKYISLTLHTKHWREMCRWSIAHTLHLNSISKQRRKKRKREENITFAASSSLCSFVHFDTHTPTTNDVHIS